jgi:hypothetical protein
VNKYFAILAHLSIVVHEVAVGISIVQGIESNVRHHRRFIPMLWGEQRQDDYFKDFPHGGRLDMRFTRANNVNGSLYSPKNYTFNGTLIAPAQRGIAAPWSFPVPMQHYSHMLNYDYFKVNQPYVRHLILCAFHPAALLATSMKL